MLNSWEVADGPSFALLYAEFPKPLKAVFRSGPLHLHA